MEQILRIFRKDFKHLWLSVLVVLALIVSHAIVDVRISQIGHETSAFASVSTLLNLFLPMAIWFLIAQVVFQEAMPGEQQFWLTRPYSRIKLLAAKVLFVVAFISIPLFLSDCYILAVQGLPVFGDFRELLLRQVIVSAIFILPSFAIAAVTSGLTQFVLAWLLLVFLLVGAMLVMNAIFGGAHTGVSVDVIAPSFPILAAVIASGVIVWQYAARRTILVRLILLAIVCTFLPIDFGRLLGNHFRPAEPTGLGAPDGLNVQIANDPSVRAPLGRNWQGPPTGYVQLRFPLTVSGLPADTELSGTATATISAGGRSWPVSGGVYSGSVGKIRW